MKDVIKAQIFLLFLSACFPNPPAQAVANDVRDTVVVTTVPDTLPAVADKQPAAEATPTTLSGTFHLYYVSEYGDKISEVDSCRLAAGDGEYLAFVLKTDKPVDVSPFLDRDELQALVDIEGSVMQSEFMLVPDQDLFETISWRDYAERFAHKRVCVSGTLFFPMAGWHYITPMALEFSKVEVADP